MERVRHEDAADRFGRTGPCWLPALLLCATLAAGCQPYSLRDRQVPVPAQVQYAAYMPAADNAASASGNVAQAQSRLEAGILQEKAGREDCVDSYYHAAIDAWQFLASRPASATDPSYRAAWQIYQQSLARLVASGSRYGRLDPRKQLMVADASGRYPVPIAYYGFPWKPQEFCQLLSAADFSSQDIAHHYRTSGLGASLVAIRKACNAEPFYPPQQYFPLTAILRAAPSAQVPAGGGIPANPRDCGPVLEFYNPCQHDSLRVGPTVVGLERDLTAPFACQLRDVPRKYMEGFFDPGDADVKPELVVMEPYQPGKIPVVFIHGLWSDPITWVDAANGLRSQSDIYRQYQFWFFRYPTGKGLLESAAVLRAKLLLARETFDPAHRDAALDRMVLVGHSMGGLVARFQVTYAYDILWRHAAGRPLEAVRTTPPMREHLRQAFFFDPSPLVSRVVFIGTPHRGSSMANRLVGRVASDLVSISAPEETQYRQLMDYNRDIFADYLWRSWPTCVDCLEPSNPLLDALAQMPFSPRVRLHSIIGTGGMAVAGGPSDGVVPVSSAVLAGVSSQLFVPVRHEKLHRNDSSVNEIARILREHARG